MNVVNTDALVALAGQIGIPEHMIVINGHAEWAWSVEQAADDRWEVYWFERGIKNDLEVFESEHQACGYLLGRLTYSKILAQNAQ